MIFPKEDIKNLNLTSNITETNKIPIPDAPVKVGTLLFNTTNGTIFIHDVRR